MIVEIAGRPSEHIKEYLSNHIMVLEKLNDVEVHSIKINDPKELEKKEGENEVSYTCFAEADFEVETLGRLTELIFDFMPSSIEVIEPGNLKMSQADATSLMNNISGRLHRYDEFAKVAGNRIKELESALEKTKITKKQNHSPINISYGENNQKEKNNLTEENFKEEESGNNLTEKKENFKEPESTKK
jgi:hypothetical protein